MASDRRGVRDFFRAYGAGPVGPTPPQPIQPPDADEDSETAPVIDRNVERPEAEWEPMTVPEQPARDGEFPVRFVDGSMATVPALCVRTADGHPVPMLIGEAGAVVLRSVGRGFEREFVALDRVLSFVADRFPWEALEPFATGLLEAPEFSVRFLPANTPAGPHNPFDYEVLRSQAYSRIRQEMATFERLALNADAAPTLVDGPLYRVTGTPKAGAALVVGVVKEQMRNYLHPQGCVTLLDLRTGQRTPVFKIEQKAKLHVATWFLKLAGGPRLAPNWGFVRVEIPWGQYQEYADNAGFVHRLSRWLIDARCRTDSYARMPVSLDPIVRAEDALKPLFTPLPLLATRLYRTAGLFQRGDL